MGNNKRLQKSLKRYLSKMKNRSRSLKRPQLQLSSLNNSMMMSTKSFLSGCKHTKTQSFALDETRERGEGSGNPRARDDEAAAQLEDIDKFLFENFRSLYLGDVDVDHHVVDNNNNNNNQSVDDNDEAKKKKGKERMILFDSPRSADEFYLRRGSSSSSSSLVDELFRNSLTMSEEITGEPTTTPNNNNNNMGVVDSSRKEGKVLEGSIAVLTYSSSPYDDFKKSMQEMVDAKKRSDDDDRSIDWELMEEILFCFIKLNDKKSYKYLINAFVDLVITLRDAQTTTPQHPSPPTATATTVMSVRRKKRPDHF